MHHFRYFFKRRIIGWVIAASFLMLPLISVQGFDLLEQGGLKNTAKEIGYTTENTEKTPAQIIGEIVQVLLSFVGVVMLLLVIYGGYLWMTAAGNDQQVAKARGIIINAAVGLLIVLSAYALTKLASIIWAESIQYYQEPPI